MPDPGTKPPSPTKAVALVATAAGVVALLVMWLILRPPAAHYRTIIAIFAIAGIISGAVLVLALLVRLVEYRFTRRYEDAEAAQNEHRQFVQAHLGVLIAQQHAFDAVIAKMSEAIGVITEQTQSNCKHIELLETQVARCMAEIGIVSESIDELRVAFVDDGLPLDLPGNRTDTLRSRQHNGAAGEHLPRRPLLRADHVGLAARSRGLHFSSTTS
jgi:hypothetical protein